MLGFVGPFGDANFGDYAMLINNVYDFNDSCIKLFTYEAQFVEQLKENYLADYSVQIVCTEVNMEIPEAKEGKVAYYELSNCQYTPIEVLECIENIDEIKMSMADIEALVVTGGGYLNHYWTARSRMPKLLSILGTILIANQLKKPVIFMGNTFGPFDESREFFKYILGRLETAVWAARDACYSPMNLREIGMTDHITPLIDDLYFLNEKLKKTEETDKQEKYIILDLCVSMQEIEDNQEDIRKFIESIQSNFGFRVYLMPLDKGYGGLNQAHAVKRLAPDVKVIDIVEKNGYLPVEMAHDLIKNAQFVVCQKYHLFTLCVANNVPVVQILRDIWGDKRYTYSKSVGVLAKVFENQVWDEGRFFVSDISKLKYVSHQLPGLIKHQKQLFNEKKSEREFDEKEVRNRYISRSRLSETCLN